MPTLADTAKALVAPGMGILAADESEGTIAKRFAVIGLPVTFETRRDYREMLFRSREAMSKYITGVILTEETLLQSAAVCSARPYENVSGQGCGPSRFIAERLAVAASSLCPPLRKAMPGTSGGTSDLNTSRVRAAISSEPAE